MEAPTQRHTRLPMAANAMGATSVVQLYMGFFNECTRVSQSARARAQKALESTLRRVYRDLRVQYEYIEPAQQSASGLI